MVENPTLKTISAAIGASVGYFIAQHITVDVNNKSAQQSIEPIKLAGNNLCSPVILFWEPMYISRNYIAIIDEYCFPVTPTRD